MEEYFCDTDEIDVENYFRDLPVLREMKQRIKQGDNNE